MSKFSSESRVLDFDFFPLIFINVFRAIFEKLRDEIGKSGNSLSLSEIAKRQLQHKVKVDLKK